MWQLRKTRATSRDKAMTTAATRRSPALLPGVVALVACLTVGRLTAQAGFLSGIVYSFSLSLSLSLFLSLPMFAFLSVFLAVARPCHQQAVCQSAHPSAQMHVVGLFIPFFDASADISENSGFGGLTLGLGAWLKRGRPEAP